MSDGGWSYGGIDWDAVRARVDEVGRALSGTGALSPEEARRVLEERARRLARPAADAGAAPAGLEVVTFALAGETYAIEARWVVEVARLAHLTPLPGAEPPLFAVTAWRGDLLSLFDLRPVLGLSSRALDDLGWIVVLGSAGRAAFGVLADAPGEFRVIPPDEVRPPEGAARSPLVRGVTGDAVVVLEGEEVVRSA